MAPRVMDTDDDSWAKLGFRDLRILQTQMQKPDVVVSNSPAATYFNGVIIVGAGPSGLATAACLKEKGVGSLIIEKSECLASLWQQNTYDRLHLHLPKRFCELPLYPFPAHLPTYPTRLQFVDYLQDYAKRFELNPIFNRNVDSAEFDHRSGLWQVKTKSSSTNMVDASGSASDMHHREFRAKWLVVASGENAEPILPVFPGMKNFTAGRMFHSSQYKSGAEFQGKKVLVVGCGNSGMEISLDLVNFGAQPTLVARSPAHILPREMLGRSTYEVAQRLMTTFPCWLTDMLLVSYTYLALGDTARYGIRRPASEGPLALKHKYGKTPILDVGTFAKIKSGHIKVVPGIRSMTATGAQFEDGQTADFDTVIFATGYRSNVPKWLKDDGKFFSTDGMPRKPAPHGWKADESLYVAGLGRRGLSGAAFDSKQIASDISATYKNYSSNNINISAFGINQVVPLNAARRLSVKYQY